MMIIQKQLLNSSIQTTLQFDSSEFHKFLFSEKMKIKQTCHLSELNINILVKLQWCWWMWRSQNRNYGVCEFLKRFKTIQKIGCKISERSSTDGPTGCVSKILWKYCFKEHDFFVCFILAKPIPINSIAKCTNVSELTPIWDSFFKVFDLLCFRHR